MHGCDDAAVSGAEMVRVTAVRKRFGAIDAVNPVSFSLPTGSILGLLGSDGAGKSTLLRMLAGMIQPDAGSIHIDGLDAGAHRKALKDRVGYMPQRFGLYQDLSVLENFTFFMDIFDIRGAAREEGKKRYLGFSNLLSFEDRLAGDLSGGMKQKLGLACVLVHRPKLLILDEPTNGVDPVSRREFWEMIEVMRGEGMTVIVSTAYQDEGRRCDRLMLMHEGDVLGQGTPETLQGASDSLEAAMIDLIARRMENPSGGRDGGGQNGH